MERTNLMGGGYEIRWEEEVHGVKHASVVVPGGIAAGMEIPMPGCGLNAVVIRTATAYLICGIADITVCEELGDVAAVGNGTSLAMLLESPVRSVTSQAKALGAQEGMTGLDVLKIFV